MRASLRTNGPAFSATRMIEDYVTGFYPAPARRRGPLIAHSARGERRHEPVEGRLEVDREPEAPGGLERDEPVQRAADRADRVDGRLAAQLPAAQHGEHDVEHLARPPPRAPSSPGAGARSVAA